MEITPAIKEQLKRVVWDYAVDEQMLCDIFEGKMSTFSLSRAKLCSRLLLSTKWYKLLDCLGREGLTEILTDEVIDQIWIRDVREKFKYAGDVLHGLS